MGAAERWLKVRARRLEVRGRCSYAIGLLCECAGIRARRHVDLGVEDCGLARLGDGVGGLGRAAGMVGRTRSEDQVRLESSVLETSVGLEVFGKEQSRLLDTVDRLLNGDLFKV